MLEQGQRRCGVAPPLCHTTQVEVRSGNGRFILQGDAKRQRLGSCVARIGEILSYQSYNTKSPLNGEAAKWTDQNIPRLPLDAVSAGAPRAEEDPQWRETRTRGKRTAGGRDAR